MSWFLKYKFLFCIFILLLLFNVLCHLVALFINWVHLFFLCHYYFLQDYAGFMRILFHILVLLFLFSLAVFFYLLLFINVVSVYYFGKTKKGSKLVDQHWHFVLGFRCYFPSLCLFFFFSCLLLWVYAYLSVYDCHFLCYSLFHTLFHKCLTRDRSNFPNWKKTMRPRKWDLARLRLTYGWSGRKMKKKKGTRPDQ